ncbi:hypothetical protein D6D01_07863 [Aureobasidium pullulans]|uniref:CCHC-type domain-containing protein n=1 Tax=Aureobasidium pullulans TaxID=5580 RepID=A0A4S9KHX4_AURPU|nr:hypothetical protein D6D01_07863 [Aureobasidium pullulans]
MGYEIDHLDWLLKPKPGQATGTMVISFLSKAGANAALAAEVLAWEGGIKRTVRYSRACRVLQCFKCYGYGHTTRNCRNTEKCGHCAQEHLTKDCPAPTGTKTCALCKGNHPAWAQSCKYRQKEMERVEAEKTKTVLPGGPSNQPWNLGKRLYRFLRSPGPRGNHDGRTYPGRGSIRNAKREPNRELDIQSGCATKEPNLSSILKKAKTPQRTRATAAAKTRITGITPMQVKKRVFGQAATSSSQEERQCEPGSDAIEIVDPSQHRGSSPPLLPDAPWESVTRPRSGRMSTTRTRETTTTDE